MLLDVDGARLQTTEALGEVCYQKLLDEGFGVAIEVTWECHFASQNLLVDAHRIVIYKRWLTRHHLVQENA